jgi:6-pyruvoyltetrahydropterin/6-carboxytetrahydropterin synthase
VIEVTVLGDVLNHQGHGDDGMVLDFGDIKKITNELIVEPWDHAFLVAKEDEVLVNFLATIPGHKTIVLDCIPTVENLAQTAFKILEPVLKDRFHGRLNLSRLRIYETPNCWADVHA